MFISAHSTKVFGFGKRPSIQKSNGVFLEVLVSRVCLENLVVEGPISGWEVGGSAVWSGGVGGDLQIEIV